MAGIVLKVEAVGYRDVLGRFARRAQGLADAQREVVRRGAQSMWAMLRYFAPKRTGEFAEGLNYRTDETAGGTTATFYAKGKHAYLLPWIVSGTPPHEIPIGGSAAQMAKGYPLHFYWERIGEWVSFWSVHHPGTKPNPFVGKAMAVSWPTMRDDMRKTARRVIYG